ncbi:hypothetical protein BRADI_2g20375v3 [Brachypodium distachyon]|uniref:DUF1618 domain-containing protein n=1 Tax=Brachypodium distachyon TaxID=15368 RepID=A0A0Q3K3X7_BRADI|nr:hypothetical protein BRADI_2g20375v3 [Brachypodium distachyon]
MAAACVLVDSLAYIDTNDSTTHGFISKGNLIAVSLWPAHPPIPSRVSVHGLRLHPGEDLFEEPSILCTVDCFFVLRIAIERSPPPRNITQKMSDYFIYRSASSTDSSLKLLPHPHPRLFGDSEVGVLPRGDHFTIAVLSQPFYSTAISCSTCSNLRTGIGPSKKVLVDPPQIPFPMPLPDDGRRHFRHVTNSVITIGSRGTVGWVDLWHGILLYDVLSDNDDKVHLVPLPVRLGSHGGMALDCCPRPYRNVAVMGDCLKFVELEAFGDRLPGK